MGKFVRFLWNLCFKQRARRVLTSFLCRPTFELLEPRMAPSIFSGAMVPATTGGLFTSVAVGDFNSDGKPDLVATDQANNDASILLNNGAGGFFPPTNFPAGTLPGAVAVGDFNGDGKLDLAVGNAGANRGVSILLGDGTGGFSTPTTIPITNGATSIAVGDFNGDGNLDLAAADSLGFNILFGNGKGGFSSPTQITVHGYSTSLVAADFNGDGNLDLAVADSNFNTVSILLGDGQGGFSSPTNYTVGPNPSSIAVGDFNNDGNLDLAVANSGSNNVSILLGDGKGGFSSPTNYAVGTGPTSIAVGDFNNDGNLDLAVTNNDNNVSILFGNGTGRFSAPTNYYEGFGPQSEAVGDFGGNGDLDLAFANGSNVSLLTGNGAGGFSKTTTFPAGTDPSSVAVGDFNGDGIPDLAVGNVGSINVSILLGNGTGAFSSPINSSVAAFGASVAVGDFNGDGNLDVATIGRVLLGNGAGGFSQVVNFGVGRGPDSLAVGDFTGDGDLDLAVANSTDNTVSIVLGDGTGNFSSATNFATGSDPTAIAVGDFTGNGNLDLAVTNFADNTVSILLGDGMGGFSAATNYATGSGPCAVAVGDFTDNGILDLAIANKNANTVSILLGNGKGGFSAAKSFVVGLDPVAVAVADFTGDGKLDVATANEESNDVSILLGDGAGGFGPPNDFLTGVFPTSLAVGDFDGNGGPDLAVAGGFPGVVSGVTVLLNQAVAARFGVTAPPNVIVGSSYLATVTALDKLNNPAPGYSGTVHFTSSDAQAVLPADATLTNGTGVFSVTLNTIGNQTLTVIDTARSSTLGTSAITVQPFPPTHYALSVPAKTSAGSAFVVVVTALDQFNNITTSYNGTIQFASSDGLASLPQSDTVTHGVGAFAVSLKTAGSQIIVATDAANANITSISSPITVSAAAVNHLAVMDPASAVTGSPFPFTVTAQDLYGNTAPTYNGTVRFTSSDSAAALPAFGSLTNGVGTFSATFQTTTPGTPANPGTQTLTATDNSVSSIAGTAVTTVHGFTVSSLSPTSTGFAVTFDKPFDPTTLNLYFGPSDVSLMGGAGPPIRGSLVLNTAGAGPPNTSFTFIATETGSSAGVLSAGTYTVTIASGVKDGAGSQLDGSDDGAPGQNFVGTFTVLSASTTSILSIPDFARGPDSSANIQVPNNTAAGIPITLSNAVAVTDVAFDLTFNPALLNVSGALALNGSSGTFTLLSNSAGTASFVFHSPTPLNGTVVLGDILAQVPDSAANTYKAKELLHLGNILINGGAAPVLNADGIQVVAYLGDVSAHGSFSSLDAVLLSRVAVNLDSGFAAYPQLDPAIVGDIAGSGTITSSDVTLMNRLLAGVVAPQIPPPPAGLTITPTGPDPTLSVPTDWQVIPGSTVVVPVNIDTAKPAGSTGMTEAVLALQFDPKVFSVSAADVQLGTLPSASSGWQLQTVVNAQTEEIGIDLFSATPIQTQAGGSLVTIALQVRDTAPAGTTGLSLVRQVNPTGQRVFRTEAADAQGALVVHTSNKGQWIMDNGQWTADAAVAGSSGSSAGDAKDNLCSSPSTEATSSPTTNHQPPTTRPVLKQVFGDLDGLLIRDSLYAQPEAVLNSLTSDSLPTGVRDQALIRQSALTGDKWDAFLAQPDEPAPAGDLDSPLPFGD